MNIGIFDPYLDTMGGGEKYMLTIAEFLSQKNDVSIFWNPNDESKIKKNAEDKFDIDLSKVSFVSNIFNNTSFISRIIETTKYNLIIFLSDGSVPFVETRLFIHFQFPVEWIEGKNFLTQLKIKRAEKIFCNSKFTKSFIDKKLGVDSIVIYPPSDTRCETIKKENIILHVGRFGQNIEGVNYKKQDFMINGFKTMVDRGLKRWKFVLAISVREEDEKNFRILKEMANGYPIVFLKNVSNSNLRKIYSKAKIYWHASGFGEDLVRHPERAEHFGIATVEAMAAGCVPVVINAGGQTEIVEEGVSGYLWSSTDELFEKTEKVIKNSSLRASLAKKAQARSKLFSKEEFHKKLGEIT